MIFISNVRLKGPTTGLVGNVSGVWGCGTYILLVLQSQVISFPPVGVT